MVSVLGSALSPLLFTECMNTITRDQPKPQSWYSWYADNVLLCVVTKATASVES